MTVTSPIRRAVVAGDDLEAMRAWTTEVEAWPVGSHRWGQYAERTETRRGHLPDRERVGLPRRVRGAGRRARWRTWPRSVLGVEVAGFKDKINYKQPGGAGFRPHQDLAAYPGASRVMSVLVAIDECTHGIGVRLVRVRCRRAAATDDRGVVRPDVVAALVVDAGRARPR